MTDDLSHDDADDGVTELAPLDDLIGLLPQIAGARERARLGTALQKATASAAELDYCPDLLADLALLAAASSRDLAPLRASIGPQLASVLELGRKLSGELTTESLSAAAQTDLPRLEFAVERIRDCVEGLWREATEADLGGQAALGEVLTGIATTETLGRDLVRLGVRVKRLVDRNTPAADRIVERDKLIAQASALDARLHETGVAPPIAHFLLTVAVRPARLSELTDEILAWIRDHDALDRFVVSTRGAN